ncbi:hypothetical protein BU16DRAFT_387702 [Lophium mytilinum]|uniref:Uncharacterized protein n=1 Tax=Lophium mytilinum TaxID=390894 RepID=A0A6A6QT57_9PEZI|nr:hypothetical protein BU16DRAFT_387702 [Lophium mytilinum]
MTPKTSLALPAAAESAVSCSSTAPHALVPKPARLRFPDSHRRLHLNSRRLPKAALTDSERLLWCSHNPLKFMPSVTECRSRSRLAPPDTALASRMAHCQ